MSEGENHSQRPYRVLSLDGGGMRGIYTAAFLDRLLAQQAARSGKAPLDLGLGFDLIVGTSTGAIVAAAAAVGVPMKEVVALYEDYGPKIFPHRIKGKLSAIFRAFTGGYFVRRGDQALRKALANVLEDVTMLDVFEKRGISLAIPAVRMSTHKAWVFKKTPKSGVRDDNYKLTDVCMASSAAPIFRSLAAIDDPGEGGGGKQIFCDGGLWANNPIMVGFTDALANAAPTQPIEIFSLGTCPRPEGEHIPAGKVHRSMLSWALGADVAPLGISAQEFAYDNMARLLANAISDCGRTIRRVRFPNKDVPASMMAYLALDDSREEAMHRLVQQAHTDADMTRSACDDPMNSEGQLIRAMLESLPPLDPARTLRRPAEATA
ncbi:MULTISPECIES: patatin-like phospholipase family protein [Sphingomonas]|uniref:Patatin n=1 Tax=Sphingomonas adhaesiva TaxID=28212 RepID=A0A2A4I507_9SPHN|nr:MULTISPECIES: patatin-like phospholipase family protein [Sphingomonas]PCG13178.1 patatin [Sphingomonas adhaesiva]